jgi:hypothetical protein
LSVRSLQVVDTLMSFLKLFRVGLVPTLQAEALIFVKSLQQDLFPGP